MNDISPKALFIKSLKPDSKFRSIVAGDEFQSAVIHALAQMQLARDCTTEQLAGARRFVECLSNLAEADPVPSTFPTKRLVEPGREPETAKK